MRPELCRGRRGGSANQTLIIHNVIAAGDPVVFALRDPRSWALGLVCQFSNLVDFSNLNFLRMCFPIPFGDGN